MRHFAALIVSLALSLAVSQAFAADTRTIAGRITYVSKDALEVEGRRILITPESSVISQGRPISRKSLRRGSFAEAEVDPAGRLIELRVNRAVE